MNRNNNAVIMQELIQRVNSNEKTMHTIGNVQERDQGVATFSNLVPVRASDASGVFPGENGFSVAPLASAAPLPSASFAEYQNGSPPILRPNPPRAFHSPSRSFSMPSTSRVMTYGQFNVTHVPRASLFHADSSYPGVTTMLPGTVPERYRMMHSHPSHILPRFQGSLARCPSNALPNYRTPYASTIMPGATSGPIRGPNPSPEKEQKESSNSRKKRKACGHCEPCRRKENCGSCMNCINRAKGKQICIHRKCEVLKKKPSTASFLNSCDPIHEKRKDFDGGLLPKQAKRSKSIDNSNDPLSGSTHPLLHSNFSDFSELNPSLIPQSFHPTTIQSTRPDLPASSDNFSSFLASTTCSLNIPPSNSSNNISVPVEASDFINQTINEIESNMQKCDQNSPRGDDNFSQLHELQPTVQLAPNSYFSWTATDLPGKLLKSLTSDNNPSMTSQATGIAAPDQITKVDPLLESLTTANQETINPENVAPQTLHSQISQNGRLIAGNPEQIQQSISSGSRIQKSELPRYNQPPVSQLSSPAHVLSTTISNPLPHFSPVVPHSGQSVAPLSTNFQLQGQIPPSYSGFNQFEAETNGQVLQNMNTWNFQPQSMQNLPSYPAAQTDSGAQPPDFRPPSNTQDSPGVPSRKVSNNSVESLRLQRHLSVGSRSSNQSPLMHASPGAGSSVLHQGLVGTHNHLKSPMTNLPAHSPAPSHLSGMMGSPVNSMRVSPGQSQSPFTPGPGTSDFSASLPDQELKQNGPPSWPENHESKMNMLPSYDFAARSVALTGNCIQPCASPIAPKPVPNRFLVEPGSSNPSNVPCSVNQALQNSQMCSQGSVSTSAVRLKQSDSHISVDSAGPSLCEYPSNTQPSPHHIFTETMNTVLYGNTAARPKDEVRNCSKAKLKTDLSCINGTHLIESPTDVHATISPGESGYDSAELGSVASDTMSQQSMTQGGNDFLSTSEQSTLSTLPKNEHAALAGIKYQRVFSFDHCQSDPGTSFPTSDKSNTRWLPTKAALCQAASLKSVKNELYLPRSKDILHGNENLNFFPPYTASEANATLCRSMSVDSGYPSKETINDYHLDSETNKPTVPLRRYSYQGVETQKTFQKRTPIFEASALKPSFSRTTAQSTSKDFLKSEYVDHSNQNLHSVHRTTSSSTISSYSVPAVTGFNQIYPANTSNFLPMDSSTSYLHTFPKDTELTSDHLRGRMVDYKAANGNTLKKTVFPQCDCLRVTDSDDDAPYYTHLGTASDIKGIRKLFESRTGYTGNALRIERVFYTGKEGKTSHGCPIAKWIIRRASAEEKVLVVCRKRPGHHCATTFTVIMIMLWEGIPGQLADEAYEKFTKLIPTNGVATERRCGTNDERTCACQGFNDEKGGASFSFGCSWSMYYNGCKFARSANPNKFKLSGTNDHNAESSVQDLCQHLATLISRVYKNAAPDAHRNQTEHENEGFECRLGCNQPGEGRPFSGVTCCMDFCAHSHKDKHNMDNGTTLVLTLTKPENRVIGRKPPDEQLHVLPLYRWDPCNEDGNLNGIGEKIKSGAIEILSGFRRAVRIRDKPQGTCKQRKERKKRTDLSAFITPPKRKRGRKPKRSLSMENVADMAQKTVTKQHLETHSSNLVQWESEHRYHQPPGGLPSVNSFHQPFRSPPPRWPYRRHPSTHDLNNFQSSPQSNLPSIGNIFHSSSVPCSPVEDSTNSSMSKLAPSSPQPFFQFGSRLSSTSPSPTALPSLSNDHNVVSYSHLDCSPMNSNVTVKAEPKTEPFDFYCKTPNESYVELKTYARLKSRDEIKQEPVESGLPMPNNMQSPANELLMKSPPVQKREVFSDSEESFHDPNIGGVAVAPAHGSLLIECAKRELHATTSLLKPDRFQPSRISLVFYQHKMMNYRNHGAAEYVAKEAKRIQEKAEKQEAERKAELAKQLDENNHQALHHHINPNHSPGPFFHHPNLPKPAETTVEIITDYPPGYTNQYQQSYGPPYHAMPPRPVLHPHTLNRPLGRVAYGHQSFAEMNFQNSAQIPAPWMMHSQTSHTQARPYWNPSCPSNIPVRPTFYPPRFSADTEIYRPDMLSLRPQTHPAMYQLNKSPLKQGVMSKTLYESPSKSESSNRLYTVL